MRSKDIADRAGVTVRTLRHYHQIGLLPEPSRDANGYRHYATRHLVRLLRIKRLAALGLALHELPILLDGSPERWTAVLDELDASLALRIERLKKQRSVVATLRDGGGPVDMPLDLANVLLPLEAGRSEAASKAGREQSVLVESMVTETGLRSIAELYERLASHQLAEIVADLGRRFDRLGPNGDMQEVYELADAYVRHLGPWMLEFNDVLVNQGKAGASMLLCTHAMEAVTPFQHQVITRIGSLLAEQAGSEAS